MGGRPGVSIDILYRRENYRRAAWRAGNVAGLDFGRERFRSGHATPTSRAERSNAFLRDNHSFGSRFGPLRLRPGTGCLPVPNDFATRGLFDLQEKMIEEQHICLRWADR